MANRKPAQRVKYLDDLVKHLPDLALAAREPAPLPTDREALVSVLRQYRDAWEALTTRSEDLFDEALEEMSLKELKARATSYASEETRSQLSSWLVLALEEFARERKTSR
jgi:hypothetical protein